MSFHKNIILTFLSKIAVSAIGLVMVVLVSKNFGAEGRGHLSLFVSSIALLQLFADFGNSSAIINLSYTVNQRNLWLSSILWIASVCLFGVIIFLGLNHLPYYFLVPLAAFLFSGINLNQMLMMGNQQIELRNKSLLIQPLAFLFLFCLLYHFTDLGIQAYPTALMMSLLLAFFIGFVWIKKYLNANGTRFKFESQILNKGIWVQGAQAIQFFNYRLNFFLIAALINDKALGLYSNAIVICEAVWILGHSIGQNQHMKILNSEKAQDHMDITLRMLKLNFLGTMLLCVILYLIPQSIWVMLFSKDFEALGSLFVYLLPGVLAFSLSNIYNHYFHAKSAFKTIFYFNSAGLIVGLLGAVSLMPRMGLIGACIAWSAGLIVSMICYVLAFKKIRSELFENR